MATAFAVQQRGVSGERLDGMAKRVSVVEESAPAGFPLILRDDLSLDLAGARDGVRQRRVVQRQQRIGILFQPLKELGVRYHTIFDDLRNSGLELALRERTQEIHVGQHRNRLMKRSDEILARRMIDGRLPANGGVDLRQQRRWNLDEVDAPLIGSRSETRDVTDDAAAERDESRRSVVPPGDQEIHDRTIVREILLTLAIRKGQHVDTGIHRGQGSLQRRESNLCDHIVGHDGHLRATHMAGQQLAIVDEARPDVNRVAPLAQGDGQRPLDAHTMPSSSSLSTIDRTSGLWPLPVGHEAVVGHVAIQRLALDPQPGQRCLRIPTLEQGTLLVLLSPFHQSVQRAVQMYHAAA